jgi:mannose-6-phosphate isomerase-like protein (cupin superfamily)
MTFSVRRLVTGLTPDGRSVIESDERVHPGQTGLTSAATGIQLWTALEAPPDLFAPDRETPMQPGGALFATARILPEGQGAAEPVNAEAASGDAGTGETRVAGAGDIPFYERAGDPDYHRTDSLDFVVIVSGELWLTVGDQEVHLKAGDCVVQRGTWHRWRNRGTEPAVMAAVMIRTQPLDRPVAG